MLVTSRPGARPEKLGLMQRKVTKKLFSLYGQTERQRMLRLLQIADINAKLDFLVESLQMSREDTEDTLKTARELNG